MSQPQNRILQYLIVIVAVSAITLVRIGLYPVLGDGVPLMLYLLPVMLSGILYGFWPGVFATVLSSVAGAIWFIKSMDASNTARLLVFLCVGILCSVIGAMTRSKSIRIKELLARSLEGSESERHLRLQIEAKDQDRAELIQSLAETNAQLQKSQSRFERVALAANVGIWSWSTDSKIMTTSEACNEHLGLTHVPMVDAKVLLNCIHKDDRALICDAVQKSMDHDQKFDLEFRTVIGGKGQSKWIRAAGWIDQSHDSPRLYGISIDITNHKRAIDEGAAARLVAERASEAKSRFLAQMSHEIRSPMNAILGFTQILIEDALASKNASLEGLTRIKANGDHLMHIINDILDISKFETGCITVERSRFSPTNLVEEVIFSYKHSADIKNLSLQFYATSAVPAEIVSDHSRLRQILFNLIGNALKFTELGSVIVDLDYTHGFLHFKISDTGVGLTEEQILRLFQPFEQADSRTNRKFGGTGLGLVLSRHLAQALGGDMTLYSGGCGQGCSFSFTIATGMEDAHYPLSSGFHNLNNSKVDLHDLRVLLAEDSPDGAAIVTRLLTRAKASVMIANSGFEVLEQTRLHDFDIILMDVQMPGMDGLEATRILRRSGYDKPIVALTAHALPEEKERSTRAGCNAHLTKPIDKNILLQAIQQHTQSRQIPKKITS